jgi:hypothetical protein
MSGEIAPDSLSQSFKLTDEQKEQRRQALAAAVKRMFQNTQILMAEDAGEPEMPQKTIGELMKDSRNRPKRVSPRASKRVTRYVPGK